jgi:hypothetical protein
MEPDDLNPPPPDETAFEAWLRTNAALPPLPDDHFSARVLAAVGPPARRRGSRGLCVALGLAAGLAVALAGATTAGNFSTDLPVLDAALTEALNRLLILPVAGAGVLTALSLGYAFRDRLRLLPRL